MIVWLNLVLQPCAVALDANGDHDCPHCPPAHASSAEAHHTARHAAGGAETCAVAADDCSLQDDFNYDGRGTRLELRDLPGELPILAPMAAAPVPGWRLDRSPCRLSARSSPPGTYVSLNILYCVYRD